MGERQGPQAPREGAQGGAQGEGARAQACPAAARGSGASGVGAGPQGENHPPVIDSSPPGPAMEGETYYYPVFASDPDADLLTFSLPAGPAGMTIDAEIGLLSWTPGPNDAGAAPVTVRVTDSAGAFDEQAFTLEVAPGQKPPKITSIPPLKGTAGGTYTYDATAVDPDDTNLIWTVTGPAGMAVAANGKVTWNVPAGSSGAFAASLKVTDPQGQSDTQAFSVGIPAGGGPPTVSITSPTKDTLVTKPIPVNGTAFDNDLAGYTLDLCPRGWGDPATDCRRVKDGLVPVQNGLLADFDPRLFPDGGWTLTLTAKDAAGQTSKTGVDIRIKSDKLGALRLAFNDFTVETAAVDLTLDRVYDGLDRTKGDLGYGWRYEWSMVGKGEQPADPSVGWQLTYISFPPAFELSPTSEHPITLQLADGRVFDFELYVEVDGAVSSVHQARPSFLDANGSGASLEALNAGMVPYSTVSYDLWYNFDFVSEDEFGNTAWNPKYYRVTTPFNEQYTFDSKTGKVVKFKDADGLEVDRIANTVKWKGQNLIQLTMGPDGFVSTAKDLITGNTVSYSRDAKGDLTEVTALDGAKHTFTYGADHRMLTWDAPGASPEVYEYDDKARVTKYITSDGAVTLTSYDDANKRIIQKDAAGNAVTSTYDDAGRVVKIVNPLGEETNFTYTGTNGEPASRTDALGHKWDYTYDAKGRLTAVKDPMGGTSTTQFDDLSKAAKQYTDEDGRIFKQNFDALSRPTTAVYPGSAQPVQTFSYPNQSTVVETDGLGFSATTTVDARGRTTSRMDWAGRTTTSTYDDVAHTVTISNPDGTSSVMGLDQLGRHTKLTASGMGSIEYTYGQGNIPDKVKRPDGSVVELQKDKSGEVKSVLLDGTPSVVKQKNALGQVQSIKTPGGSKSFKYDAAGRLTLESTSQGSAAYTYDAAGRVETITNDSGESQAFARDAAGRIIGLEDGAGRSVAVGYDKAGHMTSVGAGAGKTATIAYDAVGRAATITYPGGLSTSRTYVPSSDQTEEALLASMTGVDGITWSYDYDGDGNLTEVSAGAGQIWSYEYDDSAHVTKIHDALNRTTELSWDGAFLTSAKSPGGKTQSWAKDPNGQIGTWTRADGSQVTYAHDGDTVTTTLPGGAAYTVSYDSMTGSVLDTGAPGGGVEEWSDGELPIAVATGDGAYAVLDYTHDGLLEEVTAVSPAGETFVTSYTYDGGGNVASVTDPDGQTTSFEHDDQGRLTRVSRPNGTSTEYTYGAISRPATIVHKKGATVDQTYTYSYESHARLTKAVTPAGTFDYEYDNMGRLTRQKKSGGTDEVRTLDAAGNTKTKTTPGGTVTYTYDLDDQLVSETGPAGTTTYGYSARGALTQISAPAGVTSLEYDPLDRLTKVALPSGEVVEYTYDGHGRLLKRKDSKGERRCLPLPETDQRLVDCALSYSPSGAEAPSAFVFGPSGVLSRHGADGARYVWSALQETVVATTDGAGAVVGSTDYDAWGVPVQSNGESFEYGFAGERHDMVSGLVFLRSRFYHPATGRFLTPDAAEAEKDDPRSLHRYLYAFGDPLTYTDPTGEFGIASLMASMNIQSVLNRIDTAAKMCAKAQVKSQLQKAIARFMVSLFIGTTLNAILAATTGGITEYNFQEQLSKVLCSHQVTDGLLLGGAKGWQFEYKVDECGVAINRKARKKPKGKTGVPEYMDCSHIGKVSNFGISGIDVVYNDALGFELKMSDKTASGAKGEKQTRSFCRWASKVGTYVMVYAYFDFPDDAFHEKKMKQCWSCWSAPNKCKSSAPLGGLYVAFGVKKNATSKRRLYIPDPKALNCGTVVSALAN
ncbi:MAG: RHS repeat-associated core domain-containing protein [Polyangiaceae bacterium]